MERNKKIICIVIAIILIVVIVFAINKIFNNKTVEDNNTPVVNEIEDETLQQFYEDHPDFETGFEDMKSGNEINNLLTNTEN